MKWRENPILRDGERRRRRKFLLFPKKINGETRWLETATWMEVYHYDDLSSWPFKWYSEKWL